MCDDLDDYGESEEFPAEPEWPCEGCGKLLEIHYDYSGKQVTSLYCSACDEVTFPPEEGEVP